MSPFKIANKLIAHDYKIAVPAFSDEISYSIDDDCELSTYESRKDIVDLREVLVHIREYARKCSEEAKHNLKINNAFFDLIKNLVKTEPEHRSYFSKGDADTFGCDISHDWYEDPYYDLRELFN